MEFVHIDSEAFNKLKKQLDNIEREIRKLRELMETKSTDRPTFNSS
jgi:tetrahydromethanopterin S-methyltransferase subunit G